MVTFCEALFPSRTWMQAYPFEISYFELAGAYVLDVRMGRRRAFTALTLGFVATASGNGAPHDPVLVFDVQMDGVSARGDCPFLSPPTSYMASGMGVSTINIAHRCNENYFQLVALACFPPDSVTSLPQASHCGQRYVARSILWSKVRAHVKNLG